MFRLHTQIVGLPAWQLRRAQRNVSHIAICIAAQVQSNLDLREGMDKIAEPRIARLRTPAVSVTSSSVRYRYREVFCGTGNARCFLAVALDTDLLHFRSAKCSHEVVPAACCWLLHQAELAVSVEHKTMARLSFSWLVQQLNEVRPVLVLDKHLHNAWAVSLTRNIVGGIVNAQAFQLDGISTA